MNNRLGSPITRPARTHNLTTNIRTLSTQENTKNPGSHTRNRGFLYQQINLFVFFRLYGRFKQRATRTAGLFFAFSAVAGDFRLAGAALGIVGYRFCGRLSGGFRGRSFLSGSHSFGYRRSLFGRFGLLKIFLTRATYLRFAFGAVAGNFYLTGSALRVIGGRREGCSCSGAGSATPHDSQEDSPPQQEQDS